MIISRRLGISILLSGLVIVLLGACSQTAYYWQAATGHLRVLGAREPIEALLDDAALAADTRRKLVLSQHARSFAQDHLQLPNNGSYRHFVDWPEPYLVWNLVAAPALSLEPRQWCFAFVGCLSYRGYYDKADALALQQELDTAGWDTAVSGVAAYSTLGWFADPVVSTMLRWSDDALVELIFHELAHQKVYFKDDSGFNEAYATAVARIGLRQWLARQDDPVMAAAAQQRQQRQADFRALVRRHRAALAQIYSGPADDQRKRELKAAQFTALRAEHAELKARWGGYAGYDHWIASANNARFALLATYHALVPAFEALFQAKGRDWRQFHAAVEALETLDKAARRERMSQCCE